MLCSQPPFVEVIAAPQLAKPWQLMLARLGVAASVVSCETALGMRPFQAQAVLADLRQMVEVSELDRWIARYNTHHTAPLFAFCRCASATRYAQLLGATGFEARDQRINELAERFCQSFHQNAQHNLRRCDQKHTQISKTKFLKERLRRKPLFDQKG